MITATLLNRKIRLQAILLALFASCNLSKAKKSFEWKMCLETFSYINLKVSICDFIQFITKNNLKVLSSNLIIEVIFLSNNFKSRIILFLSKSFNWFLQTLQKQPMPSYFKLEWGVVHKWRHGLGWRRSNILWQQS